MEKLIGKETRSERHRYKIKISARSTDTRRKHRDRQIEEVNDGTKIATKQYVEEDNGRKKWTATTERKPTKPLNAQKKNGWRAK